MQVLEHSIDENNEIEVVNIDFKAADTKLLKSLKSYWSVRSDSYSVENIAEMNSWKRNMWRELILSYAPDKKVLKILDVGAGPGFFTINLADAGHDVCAIDVTTEMLAHAKENAEAYGVEAKFVQYDGVNVPFDDETFDLVISRNVVWNLEKPIDCMKEWKRVLKKGGRILYFDAAWYYYLYNEDALKRHIEVKKKMSLLYPEEVEYNWDSERAKKCEDIARTLEISRKQRPEWDAATMKEIGMELIDVKENIGEFVWDAKEKASYEDKPMFLVCAQK